MISIGHWFPYFSAVVCFGFEILFLDIHRFQKVALQYSGLIIELKHGLWMLQEKFASEGEARHVDRELPPCAQEATEPTVHFPVLHHRTFVGQRAHQTHRPYANLLDVAHLQNDKSPDGDVMRHETPATYVIRVCVVGVGVGVGAGGGVGPRVGVGWGGDYR